MLIFNPDGSEAESCGNALRCVARHIGKKESIIETISGIRHAFLLPNGLVKVDMGVPNNIEEREDMTTMAMGTPHAVVIVDSFSFDWEKRGNDIENMGGLFPERTNVDFVLVRDRSSIDIRTWERGVGHTLACGTGACAAVVAANMKGLVEGAVKVVSPGGTLSVERHDDGTVWMTGPAQKVFEGSYLHTA